MSTGLNVLVHHPKAAEYARLLLDRRPELTVRCSTTEADFAEQVDTADIVLAQRVPSEALTSAERLRWLQMTTAGVDSLSGAAGQLYNVRITSARGVHSDVMSDYVLCTAMALSWDLPGLLAAQRERRWTPRPVRSVAGLTMGILGLGAIGKEVARRASGLGMRVIGIRNSVGPVPGAERVLPPEALPELLGLSDFVVLAVPSTPATSRMIGEAQLRQMRPGAFLINVARGSVVDEGALIRALEERWIAGAALDVFEHEPLPSESPLWTIPNVIVTPHMSGWPADYEERVASLFLRNLEAWSSGLPMENVVDLRRGY